MFQPIYDDAREEQVLDVAQRTSGLVRELGGRFLILVDQPTELRVATAGRERAAHRMAASDRVRYVDRVRRIGEIAAENGLRAVFHQHAGTNVEFLDEVDELFLSVDDQCIGMCLDTGHLAYAGIDPVEAIGRFSDRIDHVHFKDVDGDVLARARTEGWDFWTAISAGVFCPIGRGVVDFAGIMRALEALEFSGTATLEQDRHPLSDTDPLSDLRASVAHIEPMLSTYGTRTFHKTDEETSDG
jgi:inosose dehydratase